MVKKTENKDVIPTESSSQRILLEEYRSIHSEYLNRRDEGVTRLNFFITAASVLLGGALVLAGTSDFPLVYFKIILLSAIFILIVIGLEISNFLVYRDIASDRDIRGLARIRNYFTKLDPKLEEYFVTSTTDTPTGYISRNSSGMRRVAQVIVGFLFGLALAIISTFFFLPLIINITIGVGITILVVLILELNARRKFKRALENAERSIKFGKKDK